MNKCEGDNFVGAAGVIQEGIAVDPLLAECELEAHDFGQAKLDKINRGLSNFGAKVSIKNLQNTSIPHLSYRGAEG